MLEHSAMYLNAPPQYEDDNTSFFPDFYTSSRLGPCELQDPVWAKMSALAAGVTKKRKKSETKPQAQINKCNNEKRRREQENIYIEELAELISANFADMSSLSVKPDKCAILQETVNQIRNIKQREVEAHSTDPVQQGEVSSSRPTILSNDVYGPLLLEALDGFLFVVNCEGKIEHVTENVSSFIRYEREEILGKSIYNYIHLGDHGRFSSNLMPMTLSWVNEQSATRSRSLSARFMVKPSGLGDGSSDDKPNQVVTYELMHISSTQLRDQSGSQGVGGGGSEDDSGAAGGEDGEGGPYLLCVASRISHREKALSAAIEQFTYKLDTTGKIIAVDITGLSSQYAQYFNKADLVDRMLRDMVPQQDVHKLNGHLRDTLSVGHCTSGVYRLQVAQDKTLQVQTKSKLFKTNTIENDFIMATHSILSENDAIGPSDPGGGGASTIGGPLMTSVLNGTRNGGGGGVGGPISSGSDSSSTASSSNNASLMAAAAAAASATFSTFALDNDFTFDIFPTSTWDLEAPAAWATDPRPDSRQSATPVSTPTPRPPSNPAYSPATTVAQSPLASFVAQPSPSTPASANPYSATFPFSPMGGGEPQGYGGGGGPLDSPKDTKANVLEEASSMMAESGQLRNLLLKPHTSADSSGVGLGGGGGMGGGANDDSDGRNKNRILKGLLNQQDEDDSRLTIDNRTSPRGGGLMGRSAAPGHADLPKASGSGGNNMLLQLLNEKSDDDDLEAKAGMKKKSELLQQLLKTSENRESEEEKKIDQSQEDLLRSLGFPTNSPSPPGGEPGRARKRPSDDRDDGGSCKRMSDGSQVTNNNSSSKLWEKNKMLASLLAKQPNNHQPIPPVPQSVISATPQEKLPRVTLDPSMNKGMPGQVMQGQGRMMPNHQGMTQMAQQQPHSVLAAAAAARQQQQQQQQQQQVDSMRHRVNNRQQQLQQQHQQQQQQHQQTSYLSTILAQSVQQQQQQREARQQMLNSGCFGSSPVTSSTDSVVSTVNWLDASQMSDPQLSDVLDDLIDILPPSDGMGMMSGGPLLLNRSSVEVANNYQTGMSEKIAIKNIQISLMECESAVKCSINNNNTSNTITLPSYSTATMAQGQLRSFQPPPNYHQTSLLQQQQQQQQQQQKARAVQVQMQAAAAAAARAGGGVAPQYAVSAAGNAALRQSPEGIRKQQDLMQLQRRLMETQQVTKVLVPANAATAEHGGVQNIDSLLNSTVAPNVSLERSNSLPESQLSPGYGGTLSQANQRINRQPYSPHSQMVSPMGQQQAGFPQTTVAYSQQAAARLSPQSQFNQQLSPRQVYPQATPPGQNWQQQQQQQQQQAKLSLQNPMLNAQLTRAPNQPPQPQQQQQQQAQQSPHQRSLNSPNQSTTRHSPYPADAFQPPSSPNSAASYSNHNQYLRLQRANSAPTATTQLPGGLGSPRPYGREHHPHPYPHVPPSHNHHNPHHNHMMYQDSSQYCYDQTGIQIGFNGADRGRAPPHLQAGVSGGGPTSEFVRQELRAAVAARTGQAQGGAPNRPPSQQQLITQQQQVDLEALGLSFEMAPSGASDSPKLWGAMGSDMGSMSPQPATSRSTMEEGRQGDHNKSSLLQKLLSE